MINLWSKHLIDILQSKWNVVYFNGYPELMLNHKRYNVESILLSLTELELNSCMNECEYKIRKYKLLSGLQILQNLQETHEEKWITKIDGKNSK